MLSDGEALVHKGRAMIRAAENMGAVTYPMVAGSSSADFGALPGRSPEARAEALYAGRRLRDRLFAEGIFSEPAWDILLCVFLAHREGRQADIEAALVECGVPKDAGMRFLALLTEIGLLVDTTRTDESPKRVTLSSSGLRDMNRFFELTEGEMPAGMAVKRGRMSRAAI